MDELWSKLQSDLLTNFPANYNANIQLIKDILNYKTIVHPAAVVTSYFTIISGLTAEYFYTDQGSSTSLYTVAIAKSGGGKDIAINIIPKVLGDIEEKYKNSLTPNILTSNITSVAALDKIFEDNRLIVLILDEFGDKLGQMQGGGHTRELTDKFKELYSLTDKKYESKTYSRSNKANEDKIVREYPCFILSGVTTKTQLLSRLKKEMVHDGFLNRFIFINGNDLDPYSLPKPNYETRHLQIETNSKAFTSISDFHEKIRQYENTPIKFSKEAYDCYFDEIGDPYQEGTDIYNFCKHNDNDFDTNVVMSTRWRENALRLATAITAYEFGVNTKKEEIIQFQKESHSNKKGASKTATITHHGSTEDPSMQSLENKIDAFMATKLGFKEQEGYEYKLTIVHPSLKKKHTGTEMHKEMMADFTETMLKQLIGNEEDPKVRKVAMKQITHSPTYHAMRTLKQSLSEAFEEGQQNAIKSNQGVIAFKDAYGKGQTSSRHRTTLKLEDLSATEFNELLQIAASNDFNPNVHASNKFTISLEPQAQNNPPFICKPPFTVMPFVAAKVPMVQLEKDILEWSYCFIKEQSIKFYTVFHEEVEQSQYDKQRKKAIEWLKNNHVDKKSWYTLTHLGENVRVFKDVGAATRRKLLKDLVDTGVIEQKKEGSASSYRFIHK